MGRIWLDTEFAEIEFNDRTFLELISLALIAENGKELYLQSSAFSPMLVTEWVKENVLPHLNLCAHSPYHGERTIFGDHIAHFQHGQCTFERTARGITGLSGVKAPDAILVGKHADCPWRTSEQIREEVRQFLTENAGESYEAWGWCCSYDFVVITQLFGGWSELPQGFPHVFHDLQVVLDDRNLTDDQLPQQEGAAHNALEDARHLKRLWEWLHGHRSETISASSSVSWIRVPDIPLCEERDGHLLD